ncbi:MAG: glycosyltransferase family 39 protein [Pyrinomonadaceae bacterium]
MINAGRSIHFQHYRTLPELFVSDPLLLIVLGLQTVLVLIGVSIYSSAITTWLRETYSSWRLVLIALFVLFSGAAVTPSVSEYTNSLIFAAIIRGVGLANIILLIWSIPGDLIGSVGRKLDLLLGAHPKVGGKERYLDRFVVVAGLWVLLLAGSLSYFVYQAHPHVPDESQYIFQASYMAAGQLSAKPPAVPEAFAMYMVPFEESRWYGIFSPGWPAMLAIGIKLNALWLVNPILASLCILLAYRFFGEFYSRRVARISIVLLCCSPWFVFMGMSLMSHMFTLACALAAVLLLKKALTSKKASFALLSGFVVGMLSLVRPYDAVLVAAILGGWTLISTRTKGSRYLKATLALIIGTAATGILIFPYNKVVTGQAGISPPDAYYSKYFWPGANSIGFGPGRGFGWGLDAFAGHSPLEAIVNSAVNIFLLDTELFGWGIGSLILTLLVVLSRKVRRSEVWTFAVIGTIVVGYGFFWYHGGPDFGARYWFLCIIPLIALTVSSMDWLGGEIRETGESGTVRNPRVLLSVLALCVGSMVCYFPWRALDKYYHYLGMQPGILQLAKDNNFGRSLVLIRGDEHPDFQSAWVYNPVNFEGDVPIYAFGKSGQVETQLIRAYADRPVWIVDGPTRANGTYKVVKGPLDANRMLAEERP